MHHGIDQPLFQRKDRQSGEHTARRPGKAYRVVGRMAGSAFLDRAPVGMRSGAPGRNDHPGTCARDPCFSAPRDRRHHFGSGEPARVYHHADRVAGNCRAQSAAGAQFVVENLCQRRRTSQIRGLCNGRHGWPAIVGKTMRHRARLDSALMPACQALPEQPWPRTNV